MGSPVEYIKKVLKALGYMILGFFLYFYLIESGYFSIIVWMLIMLYVFIWLFV